MVTFALMIRIIRDCLLLLFVVVFVFICVHNQCKPFIVSVNCVFYYFVQIKVNVQC